MEIRKCNIDDIAEVGGFYDTVVKHLDDNINYPKWVYKVYPSGDSVREKVQGKSQFLCKDNGKIVGAFVLNDDPDGAYEKVAWGKPLAEGEYMVCHTLATAPDQQGRGLGKQLVEFCIAYAKEQGFQGIRLDVVPDNIPAKRLYEKCGFSYVGDVDLERDIEEIPLFSMYELNF
ncbi:MAG: GNAT family N-acetyltransferase [Lachnospiraceae bacterium]|nr:GNAT family N-acetyltransferase [Lachnospiraceae bacterium]